MPRRTSFTTLCLLVFCTALALQGCSVSGSGDANTEAPEEGRTTRLALSTANGVNTLIADGASTVPVQLVVTDSNGQGVAGVTVTFSTSAGSLANGTAAAAPTLAGTTGDDGTAQVMLIAGTAAGRARVTAQVMGFSTAINVNFISGAPDRVALSATATTVNAATTTTIQATITTADNAPVEGVTVTFSLTTNNSGASLSPSTGTTNANGKVNVTYTAGSVSATDTVQAQVSQNVASTIQIAVVASTAPPPPSASSLDLLVSSPQLNSDGAETVTLTALVRNANNNFVAAVPVTFAADSGGIQVTQEMTDTSGRALASLSTAGDPSNREITVTATAGTLTSTNIVTVNGTTITLSGSNTLVLGQTTTLSLLLRDAAGNGIANQPLTLSSVLGNTLDASTVRTDFNGQALISVTATASGNDTIEATALNATGSFSLSVSSANFVFTAPTPGREIDLDTNQNIVVHWDEAGVNQAGQTIDFFATRGTLSAASAVTNANGNALVTLSSDNAGPAVVTAVANTPGGPSTQIEIEFVATTARSLILQASPSTLGINPEGTTDQQSIITAIVRDAEGNLVKNKTVSFTIFRDVSGGSIFPASAITDSFGRASTVYTAGAVPSAQDGVIIDARVAGTTGCDVTDAVPAGPCDRVTLTVARQAVFVTLGTSHLIEAPSSTQYAKPYSVLVTDANSNPIAGARVELNIFPTRYEKGFYTRFFDSSGLCLGWGKVPTVSASSTFPNADNVDQACDNEDLNRNGILNPGEDINNNRVLDPGNVATAPTSVTTDASGFGLFSVVYAREFTWVEVELEARATVAGSESFSTARFFLPGLADDFNDCEIAPPGQLSPFGLATTCGCDELTNRNCPTLSGATAEITIAITTGTVPIPDTGGTVTLQISGGTQTAFNVTTNRGRLTNAAGTTASAVIVNARETVDLTVDALPTSILVDTVNITATDLFTGQQDGLTIFQQ